MWYDGSVMTKRTYNQTCSVAGALDVLGQRWTLLLIRELLTGPKRYNDLLDALPGIGTNLLADRLKGLMHDGLIAQSKLPPPAAASVYELTEAGQRLEPVLLELVRWGMKYQRKASRKVKRSATYRASWTAVAMRAFFRPERAQGVEVSCEFRVGDEVLHADVHDGELQTGAGPARDPDVVVKTSAEVFRRFESGEDPAELEKTGKWKIIGAPSALKKFTALFELSD